MIPRFKKEQKIENLFLNKEQFLTEHNKLSSKDWRATIQEFSRFAKKNPNLCKNGKWTIEKVRRPFIEWLVNLKPRERQ